VYGNMPSLKGGNMRNAYAVLLVPAILLAGPSWGQDRAAVRMQPMVIRPPALSRPAPPPPAAPAPSQPAPVVIGPLWNPKAEAPPPPRQAPQHELTHTVQQQESRHATSVGNVVNSKQDAEKSSIDNMR
jgi:hypothetical protein